MGSKWHWLLIISKAQIFLVVSCLPPSTSLMLHHANEYKCYLYLVSVTSQTWWVRQSKWQKMFITCILAQGVFVLHCTHACVMRPWYFLQKCTLLFGNDGMELYKWKHQFNTVHLWFSLFTCWACSGFFAQSLHACGTAQLSTWVNDETSKIVCILHFASHNLSVGCELGRFYEGKDTISADADAWCQKTFEGASDVLLLLSASLKASEAPFFTICPHTPPLAGLLTSESNTQHIEFVTIFVINTHQGHINQNFQHLNMKYISFFCEVKPWSCFLPPLFYLVPFKSVRTSLPVEAATSG